MQQGIRPFEIIQVLVEERKTVSDKEILAELEALAGLPDEDTLAWEEDQTWYHTYRYIALGDVAARRKLRAAIPLLLERACYGDPGEMMRGLRHTLETIVAPEWDVLVQACVRAAAMPLPGARLWAVAELGVLRDMESLPVLLAALADPARKVRLQASSALYMLCQAYTACCDPALRALQTYIATHHDPEERRVGLAAVAEIQKLQAKG